MSNILVTGASGMLGRAVAQLLIERGNEVTVMQRRPAGLPCREILGDLQDPTSSDHAAAGQDAIVHLAAKVDVTGSWLDYEQINIAGTAHLLRAGRHAGVGRFIQVSTPAVAHTGRPLVGAAATPADPHNARGNYARSKAYAEQLALAAAGPSFAVVAVRPHLVWGPGDTQLVGRVVARARTGRLALAGTGAPLIDTTYVTNAADAIIAALDRCHTLSGRALVVTNGEPRPLTEIVTRIVRAAGVNRTPKRIAYPIAWVAGAVIDAAWAAQRRVSTPREPPITRFIAEQLATAHWFAQHETRQLLDWTPRISLTEGFAELTRWFDTHPNGRRQTC